ncbi:hypothetical protein [Micromonospora parva]|uniref:Uncharacterized protein n=1 Tax=Micromonospora parva TaxID=1464048 RepID=A0ABW6VMQ8_9ACTN|nr:hypothetical protein [Micromonospora parva]
MTGTGAPTDDDLREELAELAWLRKKPALADDVTDGATLDATSGRRPRRIRLPHACLVMIECTQFGMTGRLRDHCRLLTATPHSA